MTRPRNEAAALALIARFADLLRALAEGGEIPKRWQAEMRRRLNEAPKRSPGRPLDRGRAVAVLADWFIAAAGANEAFEGGRAEILAHPPPEEAPDRKTIPEIARRHGVAESTVRRLISRARRDERLRRDAQAVAVARMVLDDLR